MCTKGEKTFLSSKIKQQTCGLHCKHNILVHGDNILVVGVEKKKLMPSFFSINSFINPVSLLFFVYVICAEDEARSVVL